MPFHRLTIPSYTGGLPGGFDYINNAVVGTPAPADSAKAGGPNSGTYFLGFADDATAVNTNRGYKALAENTDFLDNLLRRDVASPMMASGTAGGGNGGSFTLTGPGVWIGIGGTPNTPDGINTFVEITDALDDEIIVGGTQCRVTAIAGGVPGGLFSGGNIVCTIVPAIPDGQQFRIWYALRSNLASLPVDAFVNSKVRGASNLSEPAEDLFLSLHGGGLAWNDLWTSTIYDLSLGGLNERYRRQAGLVVTTPPDSWMATALSAAGAGAWFNRDGVAITGFSRATVTANAYLDPANALFAAKMQDNNTIGAGVASVGFASYGSRGSTPSRTTWQAAHALFLGLDQMNQATFQGGGLSPSHIPDGTLVNLTFGGGNGTATLQDAVTYWFVNTGTLTTNLGAGYTYVELTWAGPHGTRPYLYLCKLVAADHLQLLNLDGTAPSTFAGSGSIKILDPNFVVGDGGSAPGGSDRIGSNLFWSAGVSNDLGTTSSNVTARFYGRFDSENPGSQPVVEWGGFHYLTTDIGGAGFKRHGALRSNGGADFNDITVSGVEVQKANTVVTTGRVYTLYPDFRPATIATSATQGAGTRCYFSDNYVGAPGTFDLTITGARDGQRFHVTIEKGSTNTLTAFNPGGTDNSSNPLTNFFSGSDATLSPTPPGGHIAYDVYEGLHTKSVGIFWTVTRYYV